MKGQIMCLLQLWMNILQHHILTLFSQLKRTYSEVFFWTLYCFHSVFGQWFILFLYVC